MALFLPSRNRKMSPEAVALPATAAAQVVSVLRLKPDKHLLRRFWLDKPGPGTAADAHTFEFAGWAFAEDPEAPVKSVALFDPQGVELVRAPVNIPRPDVASTYPQAGLHPCGFRFHFACLGPSPMATVNLIAFTAKNTAITLYELTIRNQPVSSCQTTLSPLLLTSLGRSGSTWVMGLLARHPQAVAYDPHSYDARVASYWATMFATMAQPRSSLQALHPTDLANPHWFLGGDVPDGATPPDPVMGHHLNTDTVSSLADFTLARIDRFYTAAAAAQNKPAARHFLEKCDPLLARTTLRNLYPAGREIILLRDPRDALCSVLAFNKKRGYVSFGRESVQSDADYVRWYAAPLTLLRDTLNTPHRPVVVLRYEDLVKSPHAALKTLLENLDLDASDGIIAGLLQSPDAQSLSYHRTTDSPAASIGRWKTDLSPELRAACRQHLDPLLSDLGYAPTLV